MTDMLTRALGKASSFDAEARTVDLVFASETPVRRRSYDGAFDEVLVISRQAIDTSRLDNMALLDGHDAYSGLDSRLGSIQPGSLRFEGTKAIVTAKISRSTKGDQLVRDLEDGHGLPVSVGYRIDTHERREAAGADGVATLRATRWTPLEISIVSIPADATARTRSNRQKDTPPMKVHRDYRFDDEELAQRVAELQRSQEEEVNRKLTLGEARSLARELLSVGGGDREIEASLHTAMRRGMTGMQVREAYIGLLAERDDRTPTFPHSEMYGTVDRTQALFNARRDALVARMTGKPPEGAACDFMGASLLDHARGLIEAQGVDTRSMSREEVMGYSSRRSYGMHTTSDFPMLLQGAGERVLMDAYQLVQSPLKTVLSRRSTATDFRAKTKLKVADAGYLEKVTESGEIKATTRSEAAESYKIESYGRIFSLSFQAIVNDDLGAFADWSRQAGKMAALTENKVLIDLLLANSGAGPKMGETSKNLFHADHGNLAAAGTALDETNLSAAILAFRKQKAFAHAPGAEGLRIAIAPRYLLIGPELEVTAQKLLASITPATTADATPEVIKSLVPVVEPNLDGKSWRLFADPAQQAVFEWSYLEGHEGPQLATHDEFHQLGTSFRAVLHFGAGAIDFRGAYLNPGQ